MKRIIPQAVQECNVFVNGQGYLGVTKTLKLPTMEFETIEAKGALSANYSSGILAATEVSFTIRIADRNTWLAMGLNAFSSRVPFLFTASIYQASGEPKPFSAAFTGDITKIEFADFESGAEMEVTITLQAHFVDINIDKTPIVLKDAENMILMIGGVDYMAKVRANLGE